VTSNSINASSNSSENLIIIIIISVQN